MDEMTVGVRELKAHLSEYLRRVKSGETIVISERGMPIGRLIPEAVSRELTVEERMQRLIAAGLLEWNGERLGTFEPVSLDRSDVSVSDLIMEMRE